ncbi:glycerol-3-phosphate dehydrogenase/oxidase [Lipingzhangella sp. LS1_29]|uniref:Glycerol-3-phosphate dehydrogenase n=1 Tax=Lipingzhangella rawalii TaxID=2055835 RepID=A0ABU2HBE8_9ACTN|nr:glycerol-3-phosphate dehydrogenase/oxidase [Lipingzhangella rawalii]MDS1272169.1 glycerol-3-phosphate dehydrogenase/oxidase [Lipingzhangella rawalii]
MSSTPDTSLNAARRDRELAELRDGATVDLLVVGGGVTGAGVALDAASRGLSVALVERTDLAHGTSRFSSKLVHGGLRYLASGDVALAHESARERDILLRVTAPHLVRPLPMVLPLYEQTSVAQAAVLRAGLLAGDTLSAVAGTPARRLPRSRRLSRQETRRLVPGLRSPGLRGGLLFFEGQLVDDARLVVALARTAAGHGARILTRCAAETLDAHGATIHDRYRDQRFRLRARAVVNAAGVYSQDLVPGVRLSPSRGSHLVLDRDGTGIAQAALMVPIPGTRNRFAFALPQHDGRLYTGITDEPVSGPAPEVVDVPEADIRFLTDTLGSVLHSPPGRSEVRGAFAGLRPLLDGGTDSSADLSRRHTIVTSPEGIVTVVGGKLTTYRRMAQEAVDTVLATTGLSSGPCRTHRLPLVGAAPPDRLARLDAPRRLVRRYGTEAVRVRAEAAAEAEAAQADPAAPRLDTGADVDPHTEVAAGVTMAELRFAVRHEGALDTADLLERRTRIALVAEDRVRALPAARQALSAAGLASR